MQPTLTSSFWHFKSIFLFLPLLFKSLSISNHLISSREEDLKWSLVTSPCFHSTWRGQQHEETKGIWRTPRPFVEKYLHLFTLITYLQYIQELLYNYASAEALRVVKEQKKHQNSRGNKWRPRLCNMRSPKKILVTFSPHIRMSRKLLRQ